MTLKTFVIWSSVIMTSIILLNELGYYWWRRLNRGEHWSHMRGVNSPIFEYPAYPRSDGVLNNQWRQW